MSTTRLALPSWVEQKAMGLFNIVDDEPAPVSEWLPYLAECVGAKPPRRIPAWLARLLAGEMVVGMVTEGRGFSNAKAKRELGHLDVVSEQLPEPVDVATPYPEVACSGRGSENRDGKWRRFIRGKRHPVLQERMPDASLSIQTPPQLVGRLG